MSVDTDYFTKKLNLVIRDIHQYTAEELSLELYRLASTANPTDQSARINELGRELAAEREAREKAEVELADIRKMRDLSAEDTFKALQCAESAEARIKASQERGPAAFTSSSFYRLRQSKDNHYCIALYAQPIIPPEVAELQRELRIAKAHESAEMEANKTLAMQITELQRENSELTRKLAEHQAAFVRMGYVGKVDGKEELERLLSEARNVPDGWKLVPVEMSERIVELEQRVKVLTDGLNELLHGEDFTVGYNEGTRIRELLDQTPQQTAEQIERGHVEWMKTLPSHGCFAWDVQGGWAQTSILDKGMAGVVELVTIPQLPETKESTK